MPVALAGVAAALMASLATPSLGAPRNAPDPLLLYVRARAAEGAGDGAVAASALSRASAAEPSNTTLATQALRLAIVAGDWSAAGAAAGRLEALGALPADGLLWTLSDAVRGRDWKRARTAIERLEAGGAFAFAGPVLRAWIAWGARERDPFVPLAAAKDAAARAYAEEHRALLLLADKRKAEGATAIAAVATGAGGRGQRLRVAGASRLAQLGEKASAEALLTGNEESIRAARALLAAGKPIPGAVDSAADGVAELFVRVAVDLQRERVTPLALTLARLSTYLAPDNSETALVTAELLAANGRTDAALAALAPVAANDPFAGVARAARAQLLVRAGRTADALTEARAGAEGRAAGVEEIARYADLLVEAKRHADAVPVYARAITLREAAVSGAASGAAVSGPDLWLLHLLHGGALEEAGRWPEAKAAIERARVLAPAEPQVLNFLGYAQLERRENLEQAEALIREASRLQPDDASITDSLGWALFRRGKIAEAIPVLERAAAADRRQAEIGEHLGDAYWGAGRRVDARYAWSAALLNADPVEAARLRAKLDLGLTSANAAP